MNKIIIISTVHEEMGKCNAEELVNILEKIGPETIFLEALDDTYSEYQRLCFNLNGVNHKKLEIKALQKYSIQTSFKYIPTLDKGLSDAFETKYNIICENKEHQRLLYKYNLQTSARGFEFLNSTESILLQDEMRKLENLILQDRALNNKVIEDINEYENSMIQNINSYCINNSFNIGVFMCGVAHRKSIIEKLETNKELSFNWTILDHQLNNNQVFLNV